MSLRAKRNVPSIRRPAKFGGLVSSVMTLPAGMTTSAPAGGSVPPQVAGSLHANDPSASELPAGGGTVVPVAAALPLGVLFRASADSRANSASLDAPPQALSMQLNRTASITRKLRSRTAFIFCCLPSLSRVPTVEVDTRRTPELGCRHLRLAPSK